MATQVYTFKITYADCDNRIWRTAAVSSNYTLAELGYMVLATFDFTHDISVPPLCVFKITNQAYSSFFLYRYEFIVSTPLFGNFPVCIISILLVFQDMSPYL